MVSLLFFTAKAAVVKPFWIYFEVQYAIPRTALPARQSVGCAAQRPVDRPRSAEGTVATRYFLTVPVCTMAGRRKQEKTNKRTVPYDPVTDPSSQEIL